MAIAVKDTSIKNKSIKRMLSSLSRKVPKSRFLWEMSRFLTGRSLYHQLGWYKSAWKNEAIDAKGNPIPWMTYAVIDFLEKKCNKDSKLNVWEFGSGNSTIWWSKRVGNVTAIEHHDEWYENVNKQTKNLKNAKVIFVPLGDEYPRSILKYKQKYDVIVIDGRMRVECSVASLERLKDNGVIVWDNSNDKKYINGLMALNKKGFKSIDFIGPEPIGNYLVQTTIFYRDNNVLGI